MSEVKHSVGKTIASLRKEKGMTQAALAKMLNVSDKTVSKWESEAGLPEISQFPSLAKVFEVTTDYLLTGKKVEEKIIIMSKAELCAKNDDILINNIDPFYKDEKGKSLINYIFQYKSFNVLKALILSSSTIDQLYRFIGDHFNPRSGGSCESHSKVLYYCLVTDTLDKLNSLISLKEIISLLDYRSLDKYYFPEMFNYLGKGDATEKSYSLLFSKWDRKIENNDYSNTGVHTKVIWIDGIKKLLEVSFSLNNVELFNRYYKFISEFNKYSREKIVEVKKQPNAMAPIYNGKIRLNCCIEENPFITFRKEFIISVFSKDINTGKEINNFNKEYEGECLNEYELKMIEVSEDKTISKKEMLKQSCIHGELVCIEDLLATNDFELIKSMLNNYPISFVELFYSWIIEKNYKKFYHFAVDYDLPIIEEIVEENDNKLVDYIVNCFWNVNTVNYVNNYGRRSNKELLQLQEKCSEVKSIKIENNYKHSSHTIGPVLEYYRNLKEKVIEAISLKIDKNKISGNLTKEFFINELEKGNIDLVVIKLCVKLEAILKCDYHYTGDFSEMINKFTNTFETYDDESYRYDPETPRLLNILRKQRNGIVHSEVSDSKLTDKELLSCINYICELDK